MDQFTRQIIGFGVQAGTVDRGVQCPMVNCVIRWQANLRILEVKEIKSVPYVPLSHPFVERLIRTIQREYLDQMLFWTTADLENKLLDFRTYFNSHRTHTSLEGRTPAAPASRPIVNLRSFGWQSHCRNLYQTPVA